jgi:hypothetical protein
MGFVLARDIIDFLDGKRDSMREICGRDAIRFEVHVLNGGNKRDYIESILTEKPMEN